MDFGREIRSGSSLIGLGPSTSGLRPWRVRGSAGFVLVLALLSFVLTACESEESNDIAKAQACLDKISGYPNNAAECISYVAKYDSQQANIIKCGGHLLRGGMTVQRFTKAYEALDSWSGDQANKELALMTLLTLDTNATANEAKSACERSGLKGMIYLSNIAVIGTQLGTTLAANLPGGSSFDLTNPTNLNLSQADLDALVAGCSQSPPAGSCANLDPAAVGAAALTLGQGYCSGTGANQDVCGKVENAVASSGGNTTVLGQALFCYLDGKTWNGTTCNP